MHHRRSLILSVIGALLLSAQSVRADDKEIEKLKRENETLRKQRDTALDLVKAGIESDEKLAKFLKELKERFGDERKKLIAELKDVHEYYDDLKLKLAKGKSENEALRVTHANLSEEVKALKAERDAMLKETVALRGKVLEALKDSNNQKLTAVTNKIEADTQTAKALRLLNRVEELEIRLRELVPNDRLLKPTEKTPPPTDQKGATPPPSKVTGSILAVSSVSAGLVVFNIGSDDGIKVGMTLEVARVDRDDPNKQNYLGTITVARVEPRQASGVFNGKAKDQQPKVGDAVFSKLEQK